MRRRCCLETCEWLRLILRPLMRARRLVADKLREEGPKRLPSPSDEPDVRASSSAAAADEPRAGRLREERWLAAVVVLAAVEEEVEAEEAVFVVLGVVEVEAEDACFDRRPWLRLRVAALGLSALPTDASPPLLPLCCCCSICLEDMRSLRLKFRIRGSTSTGSERARGRPRES